MATRRGYLVTAVVAACAVLCVVLVARPSQPTKPITGTGPENTVTITINAPMSRTVTVPISVREGGSFSITLASNHTTGYRWQLANQPSAGVLRKIGSTYHEPGTMLGAGGTEVWSFKTLGKGRTSLVLEYIRPWENNAEPAGRQVFGVVVE